MSKLSLKPGVVTGADYIALVKAAKEGGYALPAVNVTGTDTINSVLEAASKAKSDVIIQLSNGGAQFYAGKGLPSFTAQVMGAVAAAKHVHLLAEYYGIAVVLHTDHAAKKLLPWVEALIEKSEEEFKTTGKPLFSSHMLDLSEESLEENLEISEKFLRRMAPLGMSLEIELGCTGGEEDGVGSEDLDSQDNSRLYTQPADILKAYELLSPIGHFSVAASFGNVHGVYAPGNVKLRPEILRDAQKVVSEKTGLTNPLDFVFHGGSGSEKQKIADAVSYGVFKMNIDTDTQFAFANPVGKFVLDNPKAFLHQIDPDTQKPYKKLYDPRVWLRKGEEGVVARMAEAFADLGAVGKSVCQG